MTYFQCKGTNLNICPYTPTDLASEIHSSALKKEAADSFKTLVPSYTVSYPTRLQS
jgi:hypothetical protein